MHILSLILFISFFASLEGKKDLFDETQYKYMKMKNRVFKGAIVDYESWENDKLTEKYYQRYEKLSKAEIGTIITGGMLVEPNKDFPIPRIDKDEYIPGFKKLTDMVHKNGVNIIAQISVMKDLDLPVEEIHRILDLFAEAAERCKKAGFDGIEIGANHHGTLSQFLSPMFNHRTDEYGGSDENRARFVIEIIKKIRERMGNEYIILLKINSEDNDPNGITPEGFITACKMAEQAGVDMIEVTGMKWKKNRENKLVYFDIGKTLADILKIPILVTGGVKNLNVANEALNNSNIQYIGICRAILSEPDILIKWKNCEDKKSQCVSCMNCYDFEDGTEPECILNKRKKKKNIGKTN
jgi:2,4-dienoyl-CoA reductase-like NADH-dependent reductase (Old Yellow Enzyme family)